MGNNLGITLIALIITIIVLLILAGVSLNAVFNKNGIFSRAESATKLYGKEKSRDELTIALADAEMKKYTSGLTSDELNEILNQAGQVDVDDNTKVTVDGHNWKIDRDKLEIVEYLGEDDGIEIRYTVEGNDNWIGKNTTPNITVSVTVRNNKGELDDRSIQITKNEAPVTGTAITNGQFELKVTEKTETIFKVSAKNSKGEQSTPRTIKVIPKVDNAAPAISNQSAVANMMKITISAKALDTESGLARINYSVSPNTVKDGKASGTLTSGVPLEIETTVVGTYTVTFTATDNANNTTTPGIIASPVTTSDAISVVDLKANITASNYPEYLGMKVNYQSPKGGTWRVFYYDTTGEFGDGAGTIYLKRDYDSNLTITPYNKYNTTTPSTTAVNYMKQLNPLWANADNGKKAVVNYLENEKASAGFYEQNNTENWGNYKNESYSSYAIGTAPIEMWCKAYNAYVTEYEPSDAKLNCGIQNSDGYGWGLNNGSLAQSQSISIDTSIPQSVVIVTGNHQWLASPSSIGNRGECNVDSNSVTGGGGSDGVCPVVPLNVE